MAKLKSTRIYGDLIVDNKLTVGSSDVTTEKIENWNAAYTHSTQPHAPSSAEANVQSDWNQTVNTADDFIKNKPIIPTVTNDLTNALKSNYDAAYTHSTGTHAPSNAQKNSDITKAEIEAKLIGEITTHSHALPTHNHDDTYYTETEIDTKLSNLSVEGHTHVIGDITNLQTTLNAKADLVNGLIDSNQLPSYVDDVIEATSVSNFPTTGETGKIYVNTTNNLTYRWSGTQYVEISKSLALGETSSTAYAGNKGKAVTDDLASHKSNKSNPHEVTKTQVGLGNVDNTSDVNKPVSTATQTELNKKENTINASNPLQEKIYTGTTTLASELDKKVDKNNLITAGTKTKITYDTKGLVTGGADLVATDIPTLPQSKITNLDTDLGNKVNKNADIVGATKPKITYDTKGLVTSGADLVATDIPNLDASKITTGAFADARIPALAASKITSGTFTAARIPSLSPSKIQQDANNRFVSDAEKTTWNGKLDISSANYIKHDEVLMPTNPFGGRSLYINSIDNAMYAADKKWVVTATRHLVSYNGETYPKLNPEWVDEYTISGTGTTRTITNTPKPQYIVVYDDNTLKIPDTHYDYNSTTGIVTLNFTPTGTIRVYSGHEIPQYLDSPVNTTYIKSVLFDGSYETRLSVPNGHYMKIRITKNENGYEIFGGYPYGDIYLSYYYTGTPEKAEYRTYNYTYRLHGIGWKKLDFTDYTGTKGKANYIQKVRDGGNYGRTIMEFIIYGQDTSGGLNNTGLAQIDWKLDRPDLSSSGATVTKFGTNKLYSSLLFGDNLSDKVVIDPIGSIKINNNEIYHPGNKPTPAAIGARPAGNVPWGEVSGKPSFAPTNAQKNSDITKGEIEAKLTGEITSHTHQLKTINGQSLLGTGDITEVGPAGADGTDGTDGYTFTPSVSAAGLLSWSNDGGLTNPNSVNIKGPQGIQGPKGDNAGFGTPVATIDANVGTPSVTITSSGPDTAKIFTFGFKNLKGTQGNPGNDGTDGTDGKEVEMQVASGFIQWRYVGDTVWSNLVSLATLTGPAGSDGADGRDVKLRVSGGFIQWQYDGDVAWTNLVSLSTLTGPAGNDGTDGTDGTDGVGISSITKTNGNGSAGTTDTYTITFTDNTTTSFTVYNGSDGTDGIDGIDGTGISSTAITYKASSSGTSIPTGTWSSSVPSVTKGQYLWTRTIITFTDSTTKTSYSVSYHGLDGDDADVPDWAKNTTLGTTGNPMVIGTTPESNLITSLTMSQLASAMNITSNLPIIYGYSNTGASTTEKVVSATSSSNPFTGYIKDQIYVIEFTYGNADLNPTININSVGAKTVRRLATNGGTTTNSGIIFYNQNRCIAVFVYDGTYMIPISCFSRYMNASETKMLNYSKAETVSAITTSDDVLSAIGKLEKAVESSSGVTPWTHLGTASHTDGSASFPLVPGDTFSEYMVMYTNATNGKYTDMTEVVYGPVSLVNGMTLPGYEYSYITASSSYILIEWDRYSPPSNPKDYVVVYAR